ncbi:unnamed protein product [Rotaria sp. Silwood1]|nr:unnamed protein product [Rotaria sp. Silwood1]CAF4593837.1 unnamed protein product [Rotaria sp. Silwood1]
MRFLSLVNLFFFFALVMVLHGKLIQKRDTNEILGMRTNNDANSDEEAASNTGSSGPYRQIARIRNRYKFGKK